MIDIRDLKVKVLTLEQVENYEKKGYFEPMELNKLDPYTTNEELYALGNSLIATDFSNKTDPIVLYKGKIADGKSRFKALKNIKSNKFYFAIIPKDTNKDKVDRFIMKTQTRRDKTKTQKAISAYKYYKLNPITKYTEIAKMYGIGERTVKAVRFLDVAGFNDVIELLHKGGAYKYEAYSQALDKMIVKQTTSIQTVEKILKGIQKDVEYGKSLSELDCKSKDTNPQLMEVFDIIAKLSNKDIEQLKNRLKELS